MGLSEHERDLFKTVMNDFLITVKNCTLYDPAHPIFQLSIQKMKNSLDDWFETQASFQIGISPTQLYVTSSGIDVREGFFSEIANLLHTKGILSLEIAREIPSTELEEFIKILRLDSRTCDEEEEIENQLRHFQHIRVKEIDYQHILSSQTNHYSTEEEKIWAGLFKSSHLDEEDLPPNKIGFLFKFLKSTDKSATFLNKLYRQALRGDNDDRIVKAFQYVIFEISEYFKQQTNPQAEKQFKVDLAQILSHLHPDFISKLFNETVLRGEKFDLASHILENMPDSDLAGFIESLIANEGSINEYLLRIFNKLVPDPNRADRIAPLVADELLNKFMVTPHSLTQIQLSIKELFKQERSNHFINAMYKITVEAMSESDSDALTFTVKLAPLVHKFIKTADEERFREERTWVLLRILSQENDPSKFKKFSEQLFRVYDELIEAGDAAMIKELLSYYSHRILRDDDTDSSLLSIKKVAYQELVCTKTVERIAGLIPNSNEVELDEIANVMLLMRPHSGKVLLDFYLSRPDERKKCFRVFSRMESYIGPVILKEFERRDPPVIRELFFLLKNLDPEKLNQASQKLLKQSDTFLLWEALDHILPKSQEETSQIMNLFLKDKNPEIQRKAMIALLKGNDAASVQKLFQITRRKFSRRRFLPDLITNSGTHKVKNAFPNLKYLASKRPLFHNEKAESLRLSAVASMLLIDRDETVKLISDQWERKDRVFKDKCKKLIDRKKES